MERQLETMVFGEGQFLESRAGPANSLMSVITHRWVKSTVV